MVTAVVALFIFMAAVMAGVVLMNLTNIYFLQKKQELTIMRINGFTVREVIGYMLRETVVTTLVGIVCGIGAGLCNLLVPGWSLTVGASGAVYGILLAFGMLFPEERIYLYFLMPIKAK
jgi:ABC-type antimicrobial peptide transport system permease subunit